MKNRSFTLWSITGLALVFAMSINDSAAQAKVTSALIIPDTTGTFSPSQDTLKYEFNSIKLSDEKQKKSGNLAMLLSAILPGSGQVYAHRYYTIPLIWGFGYYFFHQFIIANDNYKKYKSLYSQSLIDSTIFSNQSTYLSWREDWHNFRDEMGFYLALTYFLNIIDAYVGATLYDFTVSDDLGGSAKIRLQIPLR
jgi:Family of unknown function (DUF5683)